MSQENRIHARIALESEIRVSSTKGVVTAKLIDLSKGGCSFSAAQAVAKVGENVDLFIPVGEGEDDEIAVIGEVVRTQNAPQGILHGMRFSLVEPAMQDKLNQHIEKLLQAHKSSTHERRYARLAKRLPLHFRQPKEMNAILKNISLGGMAMNVSKAMVLYEEVKVIVPDTANQELLILPAKVIYQHKVDESKATNYTVGLKFEPMSDVAKECLSVLLAGFAGLA